MELPVYPEETCPFDEREFHLDLVLQQIDTIMRGRPMMHTQMDTRFNVYDSLRDALSYRRYRMRDEENYFKRVVLMRTSLERVQSHRDNIVAMYHGPGVDLPTGALPAMERLFQLIHAEWDAIPDLDRARLIPDATGVDPESIEQPHPACH